VLVEDDPYALAALRYLDRNPVRAGLVNDPGACPWSSCAAYPGGADNRLATFNPAYLGLSPSAAVRQRQYRKRLEPSEHPRCERDTVAMVELRRVLFDTWHLDTPGAKD
jgi:putative transposase